MDMTYYQIQTGHTQTDSAKHPAYLIPGLCAEAGEVADKYAKAIRDSRDQEWLIDGLSKELGDVLWFVARIADLYGLSMDEIAYANLEKLRDRKMRGVIGGSGDDR